MPADSIDAVIVIAIAVVTLITIAILVGWRYSKLLPLFVRKRPLQSSGLQSENKDISLTRSILGYRATGADIEQQSTEGISPHSSTSCLVPDHWTPGRSSRADSLTVAGRPDTNEALSRQHFPDLFTNDTSPMHHPREVVTQPRPSQAKSRQTDASPPLSRDRGSPDTRFSVERDDTSSIITSSTLPPSYHTRRSVLDLAHYPQTPTSLPAPPGYSSPWSIEPPPVAFVRGKRRRASRPVGPRLSTQRPDSRARRRDDTSRTVSSTSAVMTVPANSGAPDSAEGLQRGDAKIPRKSRDGGIRLAGGPLGGPVRALDVRIGEPDAWEDEGNLGIEPPRYQADD